MEDIKALKSLYLEIDLSGCVVVAPDLPEFREVAERLTEELKGRFGGEFPVVLQGPGDPCPPPGEGTAVLLGNMAVLPSLVYLYYRHYVYCDLLYPGRDGWVVRTVHNPFGDGRNFVVLGGSDPSGVGEAVERFLSGLGPEPKLGHIVEVRTGLFPCEVPPDLPRKVEKVIKYQLVEGNPSMAFFPALASGLLYHLTGKVAWAEIWRDMFFKYFSDVVGDTSRKPTGRAEFWIWALVLTWDLIEESPAFGDPERLRVTQVLLDYTRRAARMSYLSPDNLPPGAVRWNHQTFNALSCWFGGEYFSKYYGLPEAEEWKELAEKCFEGMRGATRSHDEGGGYSSLTPEHTLIYILSRGDLDWARSEEVRAMAEWAFLVHDPTGRPVGFGDSVGWTKGRSSRYRRLWAILAAVTGEGRYAWMERWAGGGPGPVRPRAGGLIEAYTEWSRPAYAAGVTPEPPFDHSGVRAVAPLDRKVYELEAVSGGPPHDRTVDKVAFREGLGRGSAYLLWDGFGGGRHGHSDSNGVLRYHEHGRAWVVDGGYNSETGPQYHNIFLVVRDGRMADVPPFCTLEAVADLPEVKLGVLSLDRYGGLGWTRAIVRRRKRYFLVLDEAIVEEEGDYDLRLLWRWLGDAEHEGCVLRVAQEGAGAVQVSAGPEGRTRKELRHFVGRFPVWGEYPYAGPEVTVWEQRDVCRMGREDRKFWANVFLSSAGRTPEPYELTRVGEGAVQLVDPQGRSTLAGFGPFSSEDVEVDGLCFLLESEGPRVLVRGTSARVGGRSLASDGPVTCEADLDRGRLVLEAEGTVELELTSDARRVLLDGRRADASTGGGRVRLSVPSGRHVIGLRERRSWRVPDLPPVPYFPAFTPPESCKLRPVREVHLGGSVTASVPGREGAIVGCEDGKVVRLDPDLEVRWRTGRCSGPSGAPTASSARWAGPAS